LCIRKEKKWFGTHFIADFKVMQAHDEKLAAIVSGGQAVGAGRQERRPLCATSVFGMRTVYSMVWLTIRCHRYQ
jgi:hypothetical protein